MRLSKPGNLAVFSRSDRPAGDRSLRRAQGSSRRRRSGFTLMEVLATILLLTIVIPVAMQAVSLSTYIASAAQHKTIAAGLAESKLAELIATGDWIDGATSGNFGDEYPEFTWESTAANWTEANVMELNVVVYWQTARRGDESVTVSTLVYQSNASLDPTGSSSSGSTAGGSDG